MFKSLLKAAPLIGVLMAGSASAATFNIVDVIHTSANGFGSSVFHDQTSGQMNGAIKATPDSASGTWDDATGAIDFTMGLGGSASVHVTGLLNVNAGRTSTASFTGVFSNALSFAFSGIFGDQTMNFSFADTFHNPEANGTDGNIISLWGDNGKWDAYAYAGSQQWCIIDADCLGVDLRLELEPGGGGGGGIVPLPASFGFLLFGAGGLAGLRRLKKK